MSGKQFTKTVEVAEELESQKCKVTISGKEYLYGEYVLSRRSRRIFRQEINIRSHL